MAIQAQIYDTHGGDFMFSMYCKAMPRKDEYITVTAHGGPQRRFRVTYVIHDMDKDEYQAYVTKEF